MLRRTLHRIAQSFKKLRIKGVLPRERNWVARLGLEVAYNIGDIIGLAKGREVQRAFFSGTHEAVIKRACDLQAKLAESSKERFMATETATHFVVECKKRDNLIEALERDLELEARSTGHQFQNQG